jgi:hypothetical protein
VSEIIKVEFEVTAYRRSRPGEAEKHIDVELS